ncbi:MAG: hypothetical protein IPG01_19395 [Chitinophagaceae bacterium]|nr:hypothetical protein [Chitinophagaceae bacterium]
MKNVISVLSLLFIFLIIVYYLKWDVYDRIALEKDHRYTVGVIFKLKGELAGGPGIYYYFNYDKKYYEGVFESVNWRNIKIGDKVYIIFNPQNPDNNKVVMGNFAPDTLVVPEKGWSEKPGK